MKRPRFSSALDFLTSWAARLGVSSFATSIGRLSAGTAFGAAVGLLAMPVLTRINSPAEFGTLGVYASMLALVTVIGALRYDLAIPAPGDDREAGQLLVVALVSTTCLSAICALCVYAGLLEHFPGVSATADRKWLWWVPVGMFASSVYAALASWMVRRRDFATLGVTKFTQGLLQSVAQVGLGLVGLRSAALIVGQIVGSSSGILRLWRRFWKQDRSVLSDLTPRRLAHRAREYGKFPLLSSPAALLDAITGVLPLLYFASRFGATPAGLLTLVQRTIFTPLALLSTNVGQVVFGDLAEFRRSRPAELRQLFTRRLAQIAMLGLVVFVPLLVVVPAILPRLLGQRWSSASGYLLILAPMMYAGFVSAPFGYAVDVLRRQDLHILRDSVRTATMGLAILIAAHFKTSVTETLWLISAAGVLNGVAYLAASWRAISTYSGVVAGAGVAPAPAVASGASDA